MNIAFSASSSEWVILIWWIINNSHVGQSGSCRAEALGFTVPESTTSSCGNQKWKGTQSQWAPVGQPTQESQSHYKWLKTNRGGAMFNNHDPSIEVRMYGAGLFASHAGRQHAICLLIDSMWSPSAGYVSNLTCVLAGDILRIWCYDCQCASSVLHSTSFKIWIGFLFSFWQCSSFRINHCPGV